MITGSLAKLTCPFVTEKSVESKLAIPLLVSDASSPEIVIVPAEIDVSIPSPPETVSVSERREIVSVPESVAISKSVDIVVEPAAVNLPCASTVKVGISVLEP